MANEKRLIDANVAKEMIVNHANEFSDVLNRREKALLIGGGTSCIDKCPTVDAVEVVHGHWIYEDEEPDENNNVQAHCSVCNGGDIHAIQMMNEVPYCWRCGAKMDGYGNG